MRFIAMGLLLVAVVIPQTTVSALKCYSCISRKDWGTCNDEMAVTTCDPSMTACLKGELQFNDIVKVSLYAKMCVETALCQYAEESECNKQVDGGDVKCKVNCCETDLCNDSTVPVVSGIIVLACALFSFTTMI